MRGDSAFYLTRLYPMQDRVLAQLASVETGFYLTGGTAASRAYLHHRFSDDLDLFVNDDARFGLFAQRLVQDPVLGLLDSPENILANKLTAVVDRSEPKDLADIWGFCCRMGLSCEAALEGAQSKAAGLFPVDVARVLLSVTKNDWQLVRWRDAPESNRFITDLKALG